MKELLVVLFVLLSVVQVQAKSARFTADEVVAFKNVGKDSLKLHFFYPANYKKTDPEKTPAIVFFFGGGWSSGSPRQFFPYCRHLANKVMVAVSAEYRTKKSHGVIPQECVKDGKSAIRWVRKHAAEFGVDPLKIAAGGGSAGGHVAASTATATRFEEAAEDKSVSSRPNLLVLCNPVVDNGPKGYGYDRVKDYWKSFSPLHNIDSQTPNSIFFLGDEDRLIPVRVGEDWDKKIKAQGKMSELHVWKGQGHGFFNYKGKSGGEVYLQLIAKMDAFLAKNGYLKSK